MARLLVALAIVGTFSLGQGADRYVDVTHPTAGPLWEDDLTCYSCNLVLISIDTLRPDRLGCYGHRRPTSPAINDFCETAVVFDNAIAPAPSTLPSHASLFTGLMPAHHGALASSRIPLADEYLTTAELFSAIGYATAAFVDGGQMARKWNLGQGFDIYDSQTGAAYLMNTFSRRVDDAMDWLETEAPDRYMLFLHTYEVHHPYVPSEEALHALAPRLGADRARSTPLEVLHRLNDGSDPITRQVLRDIETTYEAEIRSMDMGFEKLVAALRARDDWDDTVIVFLSDHGEEFNEHGQVGWHSHTLYDELLRVPLMIRLPGDALGGRRVHDMVGLVDIAPTLADLFDLPAAGIYEGQSLLPLVAGAGRRVTPSIVSRRDRWQEKHPTSLRTPRWKLYDGKLFDLVADPGETIDVTDHHPTVRLALERELEALVSAAVPMPSEAIEIDPQLREQLRSLGYIQ